MVPQIAVIPQGMRVLDYVLLGRTPYLAPWGAEGPEDVTLVERILGDLDLDGFGAREVAALSGGERQRVVLARALAQQARVLLLDEPTTALDIGHQQQVLELVDRLRQERGIAVVGAMHDLTLAGQFADRLMLLVDGAVVACRETRRRPRPAGPHRALSSEGCRDRRARRWTGGGSAARQGIWEVECVGWPLEVPNRPSHG